MAGRGGGCAILLFLLVAAWGAVAQGPPQAGDGGGTKQQAVLNRFVGEWTYQATVFKMEGNAEEKHLSGTVSFSRILGGHFVQERSEDSDKNVVLRLYTYDTQGNRYLAWSFSSQAQFSDTPVTGQWDANARMLTWTAKGTAFQHRFVDDNTIECRMVTADDAGNALSQAEYKLARAGTSPVDVSAEDYRGSCGGRIRQTDGRPAANIPVELIRLTNGMMDNRPLADFLPLREWARWQAVTDADGAFRLDGLPAGQYAVRAAANGELATDDMPLRVVGKDDGPNSFAGTSARKRMNMSLELRPAEPLSGRVVGADGQPVAGAEIYPADRETGEEEVSPAEAYSLGQRCGPDGSFSFPLLKKGLWQFAVSIDGAKPVLTDWVSTGGSNVDVRLSGGPPAPASDIVAKTLTGESFQLSALRGRYVLLDFWATWCGPCREETPSVKAVYDALKDEARFVMVGLSLDNDIEALRKYVAENGMAWPQVFLGNWQDARLPEPFKVDAIPQIMLLDPEGKIIAKDLRGAAILERVRAALK